MRLLSFFTFFLTCSWVAQAFQMTPIYGYLSPDGRNRSAVFTLENKSEEKAAIRFKVTHRVEDIDGNETNEPTKDLFSVYPPQLILQPKEKKRVRVTWKGEKKIESERAFRFFAEQIPVEGLTKKKTGDAGGIEIMMRYIASVYVTPEGAKPKLALTESAIEEKDGKPHLKLVFKNSGNQHRLLEEPKFTVKFKDKAGEDKSVTLAPEVVKPIANKNILPGTTRRFFVPWKDKRMPASSDVKVEYKLRSL